MFILHLPHHMQYDTCYMRRRKDINGTLNVYCCCRTPSCNQMFPQNGSYNYLLQPMDYPTYPWITLSPPPTTATTNATTYAFVVVTTIGMLRFSPYLKEIKSSYIGVCSSDKYQCFIDTMSYWLYCSYHLYGNVNIDWSYS